MPPQPPHLPRRSSVIPGPRQLRHSTGIWLLSGLVLLALLLVAFYGTSHHWALGVFVFLLSLALPADVLPVTGPRGRRISAGDGIGLAAALLLPPILAPMPTLIAGLLHSAVGSTRAARRESLTEALCRSIAALAAGGIYFVLGGGATQFSLTAALAALMVYGVLRTLGSSENGRRGRGLHVATVAASAPTALLMAYLWPIWGLAGLAAAAALLSLLLLLAHLAFETALLRAQVRAMERLGAMTLAQDNLPRLVERFLQLGSALVSAQRTSLWLTDDSKYCLERVARIEADWTEADGQRTQTLSSGSAAVRFDEGLVGRVAERQLPLIVRDGAGDLRAAAAERLDRLEGAYSMLLLPLVTHGETVGVVQFERDDPQPYTRRDLGRVRALTSQAAAAVVNARRHQDVRNLAITDGLTGLFNRRHVQTVLAIEQRRARRYDRTLSVIMLDIDNFKSYNDTYGHTQGDVLIKQVASLLCADVRAVDTVGRYGGEEFIILMPETSKREAGFTAERLRQAVATALFPGHADAPEAAVSKTISLGVATLPDDAGDVGLLVTMADQALYQAKRGGRNQVVLAETSFALA